MIDATIRAPRLHWDARVQSVDIMAPPSFTWTGPSELSRPRLTANDSTQVGIGDTLTGVPKSGGVLQRVTDVAQGDFD